MNAPQQSLSVRLQAYLPARTLGRIVRWASRSENSFLKNLLIKSFMMLYRIDLQEAEYSDPKAYKSFNAFFTRKLKTGARTIDDSTGSVCSPVDGTFAEFGTISGSQLIQAKGIHYTIEQLFASQELAAMRFTNGVFATIYLAPYNYHRVHMPMDGTLMESVYVPGKLRSVNEATTTQVPGLYASNERLIQIFNGKRGPFAMVMVGATNVGSITTAWGGEIPNSVRKRGNHYLHTDKDQQTKFEKGDYIAHFNLGSTVILIAGAEQIRWAEHISTGSTTQVGEFIGRQLLN